MNLKKIFSSSFLVPISCFLLIAITVLCSRQQHTYQESNCFLVIYNHSKLPLLKLLFDPLRTDWQCYQARELSYLVDALDARFIYGCIKLKLAHFYSLSAIIFTLTGAAYISSMLRKLYSDAAEYLYYLPPLLYTLVHLDSISFFRSSKPAVAFGTTLIFFYFADLLKDPEKYSRIRSHWYAILTILLLPYFDRMGFFVTAVTAAGSITLMLAAATPQGERFQLGSKHLPALRPMVITATLSALLSVIYNFHIAPRIINALNGYYPSFEYQRLPEGSFLNIKAGVLFLIENTGHTFTALKLNPAAFAGIIIVLLVTAIALNLHKCDHLPRYFLPIWLLSLGTMVFCAAIITCRHPAMMKPDVIYGIYFLIFETLFVNFITILLFSTPGKTMLKKILVFLFAAGIAARIFMTASPPDKDGHLAMHHATTPYTIEMLNHPEKRPDRPLPQSSAHLIKFVHKRPGVLPLELTNPRFRKQDIRK